MKNIYYILLMGISVLYSCTYDYEMPDYSNARPFYNIGSIPNEVRQIWIREAENYGLNFDVSAERWETLVCELNKHGETLYEGTSRGKADHDANQLKVGYRCKGMYSTLDHNYYNICTFWLDKTFPLEISPFACKVEVSTNDMYTTIPAPDSERVYRYNITWDSSVSMLMINTTESLGYEISGTEMVIVEKDEDGNILYQGEPHNIPLSTVGTKTVEVSIDFYGWPKGTYNNKTKIGTILFEPLTLTNMTEEVTYTLSTEMNYQLETIPADKRSIPYYVKYDSSITNLMISTEETLGYEISGTEVYVTELDKDGNTLATKKIGNSQDKQSSAVGTTSIEVSIDFYGWPKGTYNNKTKVGTITFNPIKLEVDKTITLTADMDYKMVTYI